MDLLSTTFDCSKYANDRTNGMYVKYFIAFDVRGVHILRIQENMNDEYEQEEGSCLFEHIEIDYNYEIIDYFEQEKEISYEGDDRLFIDFLRKRMSMQDILKTIFELDNDKGFENDDCRSRHCTIEEMVNSDVLNNGFDTLSNITI